MSMKISRNKSIICRLPHVPSTFILLKYWTLSILFPSSTILRPTCLLIERSTMKFDKWIHADGYEVFTGSFLFVRQFNQTWLSCFFLFSSVPSCCAVFSQSFFASSWRGEAPEQTESKRLFVPRHQKAHLNSFLPLSACLLHSPSMSMSLTSTFNNASSLCPGPHTPECHNGAPWTSPSNDTQSPLSHSSFSLYVTSSSAG